MRAHAAAAAGAAWLSLLRSRAPSLLRTLYGDLPADHAALRQQTTQLSALLCNILGVYWMMRSLKDSVFATLVGLEHQPQAKMLSLFVVTATLIAYNKVIDLVSRHHLFTIVSTAYALLFLGIAGLLSSTTYGLYGPDGETLPASRGRWLGWIHYFAIESYGSIVVSLFWQYTNSLLSLEQSKSTYGLITAGGQVGAIGGCTLVVSSGYFGVARLYALGGVLTLGQPLILAATRHAAAGPGGGGSVSPAAELEAGGKQAAAEPVAEPAATPAATPAASQVTPGLLEGLRLLLRHPFVLGIFAISALFEIIATILDYQMKVLGKARYASPAEFAAFLGSFGQAANSLSLVFSVLGTSWVIRSVGLRPTLMLFPLVLMCAVGVVYSAPSMWVLFGVMCVIKGLAYALNNPSKEMLCAEMTADFGLSARLTDGGGHFARRYMATTDSVKFKSKSWIDGFGGRASKAAGSVVTHAFRQPVEHLVCAPPASPPHRSPASHLHLPASPSISPDALRLAGLVWRRRGAPLHRRRHGHRLPPPRQRRRARGAVRRDGAARCDSARGPLQGDGATVGARRPPHERGLLRRRGRVGRCSPGGRQPREVVTVTGVSLRVLVW